MTCYVIEQSFEPRNPPARITDPGAPAALGVKRCSYAGGIKLSWGKVQGARTYQVFVNAGNNEDSNGWLPIAHTTRIRTDLIGLEPGHMHHFRVRAILASGEGPYSQVVSGRAA